MATYTPHHDHQTPSLLADPQQPAPVAEPLSEEGAEFARYAQPWRDRRVIVGVATAAVVAVLLGWFFTNTWGAHQVRVGSHAVSQSAALPGAKDARAERDGNRAEATAIILPPGQELRLSRELADAETSESGRHEQLTYRVAPDSTQITNADGEAKSASLKAALNSRATGRHTRSHAAHDGGSDLQLLASIVHYAGREDPAVVAMKRCAAANTVAGLKCRQRVCRKYAGRSEACPEATVVDAENN